MMKKKRRQKRQRKQGWSSFDLAIFILTLIQILISILDLYLK